MAEEVNLEVGMKEVTRTVQRTPQGPNLELAKKLADGIVAAAQAQCDEANSGLVQAKIRAEEILTAATEEAQRRADWDRKVTQYSGKVVDAHGVFVGPIKQNGSGQ